MDYVVQNLAGDLSLDNLSRVACFSPYHFHRIFRAATDETLGDYIRRQRLESAASALTHRKANTLTALALDVGFGSLAAFTRAFKDHFGLPPSEWRKQPITSYRSKHGRQENVLKTTDSKLDQAASKAGKAKPSPQEYPEEKEQRRKLMQPKIEQARDQKVVYWRAIGEYGPHGEIGQIWQNVYQWASARGLFDGKDWALYGISLDDPYIAPKDKCRYDACVAVNEDVETDQQSTQVIPGSKIAVFLLMGIKVRWAPSTTGSSRNGCPRAVSSLGTVPATSATFPVIPWTWNPVGSSATSASPFSPPEGAFSGFIR
jgi:AraC family transcriptional regulator